MSLGASGSNIEIPYLAFYDLVISTNTGNTIPDLQKEKFRNVFFLSKFLHLCIQFISGEVTVGHTRNKMHI